MRDYKRLTERDEFDNADIIGLDSHKLASGLHFDELNKLTSALNRLAELEDKIERGEIDYVADKNKQIAHLTAENAALQKRLKNAVELPCKVGDNIYVRYYNNKEKRHCVEVERVSKTNFNITNGILSGTVYTYDFSKRHEEDNCYNMRDYNKKWFTDRVAAEARLAELKGE